MKILVFGGAGFLGNKLSNTFIEMGHDVIVYDFFKYSTQTVLNGGIKVINDDVKNLFNYLNFIKNSDYIFYLISPRLHEIKNDEEINQSLQELELVLNNINENSYFIYTSSCSVYGKNENLVDEKSETQVTSLYSKLKIASENTIINHNNDKHLILRLSTLYGNSHVYREDLIINNFATLVKRNSEIELFDPDSQRPHIHINDCVKIFAKLIEIKKTLPSKILNVGFDDLNISKRNIIKLLEKLSNKKLNVIYTNSEDSRSYRVNFNELASIYNSEYITFDRGINELIND